MRIIFNTLLFFPLTKRFMYISNVMYSLRFNHPPKCCILWQHLCASVSSYTRRELHQHQCVLPGIKGIMQVTISLTHSKCQYLWAIFIVLKLYSINWHIHKSITKNTNLQATTTKKFSRFHLFFHKKLTTAGRTGREISQTHRNSSEVLGEVPWVSPSPSWGFICLNNSRLSSLFSAWTSGV